MASKNHSLDIPIIKAGYEEFLQNGFEKASMRKIAIRAGVTVGAIYTRYPTKDGFFASLVEPLIKKAENLFMQIKDMYCIILRDGTKLNEAVYKESEMILSLLYEEYDRAKLLLCASNGSSVERFFDSIIESKIKESLQFFEKCAMPSIEPFAIRLFIQMQFYTYKYILDNDFSLDEGRKILRQASIYHMNGWIGLFNSAKEGEKDEI